MLKYLYIINNFTGFPGGCPPISSDLISNGALGPVTSRVQNSTVMVQCDHGYVSAVDMVTCEGSMMWSPDPARGAVLCNPQGTSLYLH